MRKRRNDSTLDQEDKKQVQQLSAEFVERLKDRMRRDYEQNRELMGWTACSRDITINALDYILKTRK